MSTFKDADYESLDEFEEEVDSTRLNTPLQRLLNQFTLLRIGSFLSASLLIYFTFAFWHAARRRQAAIDPKNVFPRAVLFGDSITQVSRKFQIVETSNAS
jgi:hypothetical protein